METITLVKLRLHNFGVYVDETINFEGKDIIGILAKYFDNAERSNRSGKSLILESIKYALIGKLRYSQAKKMIRRGEEAMFVEAYFRDSAGQEYKIKRGVDIKGKGLLNLNWTEKSNESQEAITELFGVTDKDFDLTTFFKQSEINGFMDLTPAKQSEHVMQWMDNNIWQEREKAVKEDIKTLKQKIKDNETVLKDVESGLELEENLLNEKELLESKLKKAKSDLTEITEAHNEAVGEYNEIKKAKREAKEQIDSINKEIRQVERNMDKVEEINEEILENKNSLVTINKELKTAKKPKKKHHELVKERSLLKVELQLQKDKLDKLQRNSSGQCPILGEPCDRVDCSAEILKILKDSITLKRNNLTTIGEEIKSIEAYDELVKEKRDCEEDIETLETRLKDINVVDNREKLLAKQEKYKKALNTEINEELIDEIRDLKEELEEAEGVVNTLNRNIGTIDEKINKAQADSDKIDHLEAINKKHRIRLQNLLYVQKMFSKSGIPAAEVENAFQEVEDDINYILDELASGLQVVFRPDRELGKWEGVCHCGFTFPKGYKKSVCEECGAPRQKARKEEMQLRILENGVESDFEGDSGGGKTIISYAVRIALTMLKRRQNKCKLNMLFLDEVDTALDPHLAGTIATSVTKLLTKKLGYEQVLMVTHKKEIQDAFSNVLMVTKHKDNSTVKFL